MSNRSWSVPLLLAGLATLLVMVVGVALAELPPGGTFIDDDGNIHEGNIEAIAAEGITKGCNPPTNDRYCPYSSLTRGQMAAFIRRALGLASSSTDFFIDDDDSVFEGDINAIAAEGITKGCNPPANDEFCPDGKIGRGQMAAFLRRAFDYPSSSTDFFIDDDDSIFEADINAIAEVGVTKGCNPPTNDQYCPDNLVRRDQMASFFARALGLAPIIPPPPTSTTTTTMSSIVAQGSGTGDDVVTLAIPAAPMVIELSHVGSSNFIVWSLDQALEKTDLLVNEIGDYEGTRLMQADGGDQVSVLEIRADGAWEYEVRRLSGEPYRSCIVTGTGDSVVRLSRFASSAGTASLTHSGSSNFIIWAWDPPDRDLLVNEIGSYAGTVVVGTGLSTWEVTADGKWSIDC